jgi:hypothetical protein
MYQLYIFIAKKSCKDLAVLQEILVSILYHNTVYFASKKERYLRGAKPFANPLIVIILQY